MRHARSCDSSLTMYASSPQRGPRSARRSASVPARLCVPGSRAGPGRRCRVPGAGLAGRIPRGLPSAPQPASRVRRPRGHRVAARCPACGDGSAAPGAIRADQPAGRGEVAGQPFAAEGILDIDQQGLELGDVPASAGHRGRNRPAHRRSKAASGRILQAHHGRQQFGDAIMAAAGHMRACAQPRPTGKVGDLRRARSAVAPYRRHGETQCYLGASSRSTRSLRLLRRSRWSDSSAPSS